MAKTVEQWETEFVKSMSDLFFDAGPASPEKFAGALRAHAFLTSVNFSMLFGIENPKFAFDSRDEILQCLMKAESEWKNRN